jgi:hypothetical protein
MPVFTEHFDIRHMDGSFCFFKMLFLAGFAFLIKKHAMLRITASNLLETNQNQPCILVNQSN